MLISVKWISDVIRDVEWVEKQQLVAKRGHSGRNFPVTSRLIERHRANSVKGQILTGQEELEEFKKKSTASWFWLNLESFTVECGDDEDADDGWHKFWKCR